MNKPLSGLLRPALDALWQWFYPECCVSCDTAISHAPIPLCPACFADLRTTAHLHETGNAAEQLFWGRIRFERAAALFYLGKHSHLRPVLHELKYRNQPQIGYALGKYAAQKLMKASAAFPLPDLLVPVPLHLKKLKLRGYNQAGWIARGMAEGMGVPYMEEALVRSVATETQTKKNREQRLDNVEKAFQAKEVEKLTGKRVLLIDDVITTGATIASAAKELNAVEGVRVSVFALAMADQG